MNKNLAPTKLLATAGTTLALAAGSAPAVSAETTHQAPSPVIAGATVAPSGPIEAAGGTIAPDQTASSPTGGLEGPASGSDTSEGAPAASTPAERQQMDELAETGIANLAKRIVRDSAKSGWVTKKPQQVRSLTGHDTILDTTVPEGSGRKAELTVIAETGSDGKMNLRPGDVKEVLVQQTSPKQNGTIDLEVNPNGSVTVDDAVTIGNTTKGNVASTAPAGPNVPLLDEEQFKNTLGNAESDVGNAERNKRPAV